MQLLQRLRQTKRKLWITVGVLLGVVALLVVAVAVAALFLWIADSRKAAQIKKNRAGMEFVPVPAGSFLMGSDTTGNNERPAHQVTITHGFLMGRYEVTAAQWKAVMSRDPYNFKGDNYPVQFVSWNHAQEFIQRLNQMNDGYTYRLPTEAEWEYACRAGTTGNYADELDWIAWYESNSDDKVHPVGERHPNAWGLYDMEGNLWEYCQDWYSENFYSQSPSSDPQGPASGPERVERGGSFRDSGPSSASYDGSNLRSSARRGIHPDGVPDSEGFRIVAIVRP
jgi:formylglycine-generating enzyme required for sulfatase activity